ncbi:MAG: energy transducer TonB [Deltaproteobacteria bacterium]|nr:energy transducer TonB [Deltaproteobacteria bacterium]
MRSMRNIPLRTVSAMGWAASILLHAAFGAFLVAGMSHAAQRPKDATIRVAIRETPRPPQKPVEVKNEAPAPRPKAEPRPKKAAKTAPPPANAPAKEPAREAPKPVFGLSANSVASGGAGVSMAVAVGNTLLAAPEKKFTPPVEVMPYTAPAEVRPPERKVVASSRLSAMPVPKKIVKADYPEDARRQGVEGAVILRLTIDEEGRVVKAVVLKGVGHGLDEISAEAARRFLFEPAKLEGTPVATVIPFTYRWELVN